MSETGGGGGNSGWGERSPKRMRPGEGEDGKDDNQDDQEAPPASGRPPLPPGASGEPPEGGPPGPGSPWGRGPHGPPPGGPPGMPPPGYPPPDYPGMPPPGYPPEGPGYPPMYGQWQQGPYGPPPPMGQPMYPPPGYYPPYPPYPHSPHHPMPPYGHPDAMHPPPYYDMGPGGPRYPPDEHGDDGEEVEEDEGGEIGTYTRLKMYVKPKVPTRQEILDRRARKNAQSRARASRLRDRIADIKAKPEGERTEEEKQLYEQYEGRRQRKNDRSRERAIEKKTEIERILNKPERKRTKLEKQFLETALSAKQRKNEGDRIRRQRIKQMNKQHQAAARAAAGLKPAPPLPPGGQSYGQGMPEIPMSPLHQGQYAASSSGMPPSGFPSPPNRKPPPVGGEEATMEGAPGGNEVAGEEGGKAGMGPFVPPSTTYEGAAQGGEPPSGDRGQFSSNVEERRNPDGSVSISIGGRTGSSSGAANPSPEMMLYGDNSGGAGASSGDGANEANPE